MGLLNKDSKGGDDKELTLEQIMAKVNENLDAKFAAKFDDFKKTGLGEAIKVHTEPINTSLSTINEALAKLVAGNGGGGGDNKGGDSKSSPEVNAQIRQLTDQVKSQGNEVNALKTAKEAAEKRAEETERHSTIRTSLNGLPFVNEKAADTAFAIVLPHVRRLEDGGLVAELAGENFPVNSFTKDFLEKEHGYLFKSSGNSGSGAPSNAGGVRMGTKVDIGSIKVGMKPEDRAAAVGQIAEILANQ